MMRFSLLAVAAVAQGEDLAYYLSEDTAYHAAENGKFQCSPQTWNVDQDGATETVIVGCKTFDGGDVGASGCSGDLDGYDAQGNATTGPWCYLVYGDTGTYMMDNNDYVKAFCSNHAGNLLYGSHGCAARVGF